MTTDCLDCEQDFDSVLLAYAWVHLRDGKVGGYCCTNG